MSYDTILQQVGEFGRYHVRVFLMLVALGTFVALQSCGLIFQNVEHDFRCAIPNYDNDTFTIQSEYHHNLINATIGYAKDDSNHLSRCTINTPVGDNLEISSSTVTGNGSVEQKCKRWMHDPELAKTSLVAELELVCDGKIYKSHISMTHLMGILVASLVGGALADFLGRKKVIVISVVLGSVAGCAIAFIDSLVQLLVLRFASSFFCTTMFIGVFVLMAEIVGPSKRTFSTMGIMLGWAIGMFVVDFVYYVIPDWRIAQIVSTAPGFLAIAYWWFLPESPRWLLLHHRIAEAEAIIVKMAEVNKVKIPNDIGMQLRSEVVSLEKESVSGQSKRKIWHMFTSRIMLIRILIISFGWCAVSMVYYGLTFSVGDLIEGSIYINFALQALMELIVYSMLMFIMDKVGRKQIYCIFILISGLACIANVGPLIAGAKIRWVDILLYSIGKLGITGSFAIIYIFTAELIPTEFRNSGLGVCSCIGRIGGVLSPYIGNLKYNIPTAFGQTLPFLIFGLVSIIAGLSALALPETRNRKLPDTIAQAEAQGKLARDYNREDEEIAL